MKKKEVKALCDFGNISENAEFIKMQLQLQIVFPIQTKNEQQQQQQMLDLFCWLVLVEEYQKISCILCIGEQRAN